MRAVTSTRLRVARSLADLPVQVTTKYETVVSLRMSGP
jgi:hypothetical protein